MSPLAGSVVEAHQKSNGIAVPSRATTAASRSGPSRPPWLRRRTSASARSLMVARDAMGSSGR
jgi:hypothetical protein